MNPHSQRIGPLIVSKARLRTKKVRKPAQKIAQTVLSLCAQATRSSSGGRVSPASIKATRSRRLEAVGAAGGVYSCVCSSWSGCGIKARPIRTG